VKPAAENRIQAIRVQERVHEEDYQEMIKSLLDLLKNRYFRKTGSYSNFAYKDSGVRENNDDDRNPGTDTR